MFSRIINNNNNFSFFGFSNLSYFVFLYNFEKVNINVKYFLHCFNMFQVKEF